MREHTQTDWFAAVLAEVAIIPVVVEYDSVFEEYTLTGISARFDDIGEAEQIPEYTITMEQPKDRSQPPQFAGLFRVTQTGGLMPWEEGYWG